MKKKKIIIFANVIMVSILALIYFLFIKNKTYTTYTKSYDEYMCWIIKNEATKIGEIYNTEIYIENLGEGYYQEFVIYYLYGNNTYSNHYYTGVHNSVRNGDYVLAKLKRNKNWNKFNIEEMYFAYDPFWGNEVELHIKTNNGKFYIISPAYNGDTYCENFYKKILENSNLDISNFKNDTSYWK